MPVLIALLLLMICLSESGLGLAIAENNLAMLGYKLIVSSDEGRFVATVKL